MKKKLFLVAGIMATLGIGQTKAQLKDVSFNVAPSLSYQWWNKNINLDNTLFYGVRAGFSFGPFLEIQGNFEKAWDLQGKLKSSNWNLSPTFLDKIPGTDINIYRISGEAKVNLLNGYFLTPYLIGGVGVQYFEHDNLDGSGEKYKENGLYYAAGAGVKFNFSKRLSLGVEVRDNIFNIDPHNAYVNPLVASKDKTLHNWAVAASLKYYFGGDFSNYFAGLDKRYRDAYNSGFVNGFKFVVEPSAMYVNFSDKLPYTDSWFVGGNVGVDFTSLIGFRAFYYQANKKPQTLNLKFNNKSYLWGGNFMARLNQPHGIVPYLNIGAGIYHSDLAFISKKNQLFGMLGGGLEIPLSKTFAIFGSANAMAMTEPHIDAAELKRPSEVKLSTMYRAGLRVNIGKLAKQYTAAQLVQTQKDISNQRINELRSKYEAEMAEINQRLIAAQAANDTLGMQLLTLQREQLAQKQVTELNQIENESARQTPTVAQMQHTNTGTTMTADEFKQLVEEVVAKVKAEMPTSQSKISDVDMSSVLAALSMQHPQLSGTVSTNKPQTETTTEGNANKELLDKISQLMQKIDRNYTEMNRLQTAGTQTPTTIITTTQPQTKDKTVYTQPVQSLSPVSVPAGQYTGSSRSFMKMNRIAIYTGPNLGGAFNWNVGFRGYMQISNTNFDFMPEVYFGIGNKTGYGVSGSVIYNFNLQAGQFLNPYVGLGLGVFSHDITRAATNAIIGTSINALGGNFFIDYSVRNLFQFNQLAVGYRFVF